MEESGRKRKSGEIDLFRNEVSAMGISPNKADIALRRSDNDPVTAMGYLLHGESSALNVNTELRDKKISHGHRQTDSDAEEEGIQGKEGEHMTVIGDSIDLSHALSEMYQDCVVCMEKFLSREMFMVSCSDAHKFCFPCIRRHVSISLNEKKVATCILCPHELTQDEIRHLFGSKSTELSKHLDAEIMNVMASQPDLYIACPSPDCMEYIEATTPGVPERCICPRCENSFCSRCKALFHGVPHEHDSYPTGGLTCAEAAETFRRWNHWRLSERADFVKKTAIQAKHNQKKIDAATKVAMKRFKELQKDEGWKEKHCRICPHCNKTVHRVDGCASMTCGRDAADKGGGNKQDGCGKKFDWEAAKKYKRGGDVAKLPKSITDVDPNAAGEVHHHLMAVPKEEANPFHKDDFILRCEVCSKEIVGPRFSCINCRGGLECCIDCSENFESLDHDPNEHAFQIFFEDACCNQSPVCIDVTDTQEVEIIVPVKKTRTRGDRKSAKKTKRSSRSQSRSLVPVVDVTVIDNDKSDVIEILD